jgi:hypothetical protein
LTFYHFFDNINNRRYAMKKFVASLSVLLFTVPMAMAQVIGSGNIGGSAAATALQTLAKWSAPTIEAIAVILLVVGILAAGFELFKRSIGWAIGLFVGSTVVFAVLWALAPTIQSVLTQIAAAVTVSG